MPGLNGFEVAKRIVADGNHTKILVFTMHDSMMLAEEVRKAGAHGLVHKSLAGRDLIRALQVILDGGTFFESGNEAQRPVRDTGSKMLLFRELAQHWMASLQRFHYSGGSVLRDKGCGYRYYSIDRAVWFVG